MTSTHLTSINPNYRPRFAIQRHQRRIFNLQAISFMMKRARYPFQSLLRIVYHNLPFSKSSTELNLKILSANSA